jgi:hypothetical protein
MSSVAKIRGAVVALALTVVTAGLSRVPVDFSTEDGGILRLSWRNRGVTVQACRTRSAEELASLPVHMRNPTACIGEIASYRLVVFVDGAVVVDDTLRPAGARGDRPVYVLEDLPLDVGRHPIAVEYTALLPEDADPPDGIVSLSWSGTISMARGRVTLITLDEQAQGLVAR